MPTDKKPPPKPRQRRLAAKDLYRHLLSDADRRIYDAASDGIDLAHEIKLLRTILALQSRDETLTPTALAQLMTILVRAVYIQHRAAGAVSEIEQELLDAAEAVLNSHLEDPA